LRYGAGIQNKVLEAMALGKPVVTTAAGTRGIEGVAGKHFQVVQDQEQELIPEILALLRDGAKRKYLGENARELVKAQYRWDLVGERLLQELERLMADGS
jgi:glycosyltransferase involved in cell wall biosynthesis